MIANVIKFEFRSHLKSTLIWSLAVAVLILFFFSFLPVFANEAESITRLLENYPPEFRAAFGFNETDMTSVLGYLSFIFVFVQLCLAIQASNYGFGLVSIEENELTADFLLSKPISRSQVLSNKLIGAGVNLLIIDLIVWLSFLLSIALFRDGQGYDSQALVLILISVLPFQLFFLSLGLMISLLVKRIRTVTPYGLALAFGAYVLNAFSGVLGDVKLELLTPFKHFDPNFIIQNSAWNTSLAMLNIGIAFIALAIAYWLFNRRDIPAVS